MTLFFFPSLSFKILFFAKDGKGNEIVAKQGTEIELKKLIFCYFSLFHLGQIHFCRRAASLGGCRGLRFSGFFLVLFLILLCWLWGIGPMGSMRKKKFQRKKKGKRKKKTASASQIGTEGRVISALISLLFLDFLLGPEDK